MRIVRTTPRDSREEAESLGRRAFAARAATRATVAARVACVVNGIRDEQPVCPAGATGLEPATPGFGDRCSTKLSYAPGHPDCSLTAWPGPVSAALRARSSPS